MIVVDASVALKCFLPEEGSAEALELVQTQACIAPDLIASEFANGMWKNVRRGRVSGAEAISALRLLPSLGIDIVSTAPLTPRALDLALFLDHPIYDCLYLALAEERNVPVVAADGGLVRKAGDRLQGRIVVRPLIDKDAG